MPQLTSVIDHFDWNHNNIAWNPEFDTLPDGLSTVKHLPERNLDDILSPHSTVGGFGNNFWDAPTAFSSMFDSEAELGSKHYTNDYFYMPGLGDLDKMNFDAGQPSVLPEGQPRNIQGEPTMLTMPFPAIQAHTIPASPPPLEPHQDQPHPSNPHHHLTLDFPEGTTHTANPNPISK